MGKWRKDELTDRIISACLNVHKELGPGFLENIYHCALIVEFKRQDIRFESEKEVRIKYLGEGVGSHRLDLFVEDQIVVELKTVKDLNKKYYAQVRSYLKAMHRDVGLLINFADYKLDVRRVELQRE